LKIVRSLFFIVTTILLIPGHNAFSQRGVLLNMSHYDEERFHFGFVLGANQAFATVRPISNLNTRVFDSTYIPDILPMPDTAIVLTVESNSNFGFVVSIIGDMKMGNHFNLRFIPTLSFGDRKLNYHVITSRKGVRSYLDITKSVPSTYISFPIELKFKSKRYNNFRSYIMTGAQYTLDLASQAKKREQKNADQKIVKFNANDIYAEAGVGFDFYNEFFKFGVELKMMYGLFDVLKHEHNIYTDSIDRINSKIFQISFTFE
jgi:hypothetical protein